MDGTTKIDKTAIIHPDAKIGEGTVVGPYAVIDANVSIGKNCRIGNFCVVTGNTTIGANCHLFTGAVIGSMPQYKKLSEDENVSLVIGDNNIFREYVTINPGTTKGGGKTILGSNNLLMAYTHVAHDCIIGNHCVLANSASLAGHVTVEDMAVVGGLTGVHQYVRLGRLSIIGGCSGVVQDIPPFSMCVGHPAKVVTINSVGLKRAEISAPTMALVKKAFKILFHSKLNRTNALAKVEQEIPSCPEIEHLMFFIKTSKRGICG